MGTWAYCSECREPLPCPWDSSNTPRQKMWIAIKGTVECEHCHHIYCLDEHTREMLFDDAADAFEKRVSLIERILKLLKPKVGEILERLPKAFVRPPKQDVTTDFLQRIANEVKSDMEEAAPKPTEFDMAYRPRMTFSQLIPEHEMERLESESKAAYEIGLHSERGETSTYEEILTAKCKQYCLLNNISLN